MFKKLFFLIFFLFPVLVPGRLSAQDETAVPSSHPQTSPQSRFIPLNQGLPSEVLKVKDESMVAVKVTMPMMAYDQRIYPNRSFGGGFVVWPEYVLTSLHLMGEFPALWLGNKDFPTAIDVFDGEAVFSASLVDYNSQADLALLKITSPYQDGKVFKQKPAKLAANTTIQDQSLSSPQVFYEKFYAFSFYKSDPNHFFVAELGPYRAITNNLDEDYIIDLPFGIVQGRIKPGFSGGPLLSPDGTVMGLLARSSEISTLVVVPEIINLFLKTAQSKLGLEAEHDQEKK